MADFFFTLSAAERGEVIQRAAIESGMSEEVLEKDIWLVWTLQQLFALPGLPDMAFKGGTALSKVFGVIERFSEDVDVSVDYRQLAPELADKDLSTLTNSARKRISADLRQRLAQLSHTVIVPHLQRAASFAQGAVGCQVEVDQTGEQIWLRYPSVAAKGGYLKDGVLIELGGRNPCAPNLSHRLTTEIAKVLPQFEWPCAEVTVLAPTRTFWEKATLMHIECSRPVGRGSDRMFRHWFDLAKLADHPIGTQALADIPLLQQVVQHKAAFFAYRAVGYHGCLSGQLKLLPPSALGDTLRADCRGMVEQRMFAANAPDFDQIMHRIQQLEQQINRAVVDHFSAPTP